MVTRKYNTRGTPKQDLTAARAELKQFRHDVAQLKKKGILDKKIYDARSVIPSKYLKSQIKKFSQVLSGVAQSVKVNKTNKKYYTEKGYLSKGNRIIVPVQKNEHAFATRSGDLRIKVSGAGGSIIKMDLKLDRNNVNEWIDQLAEVNKTLKKDEVINFQFFGNNSYRSFHDKIEGKTAWEQMAQYITNYPAFDNVENANPDKQQDFIDNITIFKVTRDKDGNIPRPERNFMAQEKSAEAKQIESDRNRARRDRRLNSMSPAQEEHYHAERAKRERERREDMRTKQDPAIITQYKEDAKKRARQSRLNKKNKSK